MAMGEIPCFVHGLFFQGPCKHDLVHGLVMERARGNTYTGGNKLPYSYSCPTINYDRPAALMSSGPHVARKISPTIHESEPSRYPEEVY